MELTGAEIVVQSLKDEGVEYVFGYPGGAVLHIYDALFRQEDVKHILVRHEQGATHAADGYARSTGKPGVVGRRAGGLSRRCERARAQAPAGAAVSVGVQYPGTAVFLCLSQ